MANEKPFNIDPPKMNIEKSANNVVTDVIKVLERDSLTEISAIWVIAILLYLNKFYLMLSYITTVSFIE